jgi:transcriptional regulator with XRE-family HTH domain
MTPARRLEQTEVRTALARKRIERGMTQEETWRATGLARATYLKLEQGRYPNPPIRYLANCAIVLGCELEELIELEWRSWWKRLPNDPDPPPDPSALWSD